MVFDVMKCQEAATEPGEASNDSNESVDVDRKLDKFLRHWIDRNLKICHRDGRNILMQVKVPGCWAEWAEISGAGLPVACWALLGSVAVVSLLTCCQCCLCCAVTPCHTQIKGTLRAGSAKGFCCSYAQCIWDILGQADCDRIQNSKDGIAKLRYYWNNTSGRSQWQRPVESETDANSGSRVTTPTTPAVKEASQQLQQLQP